LKKEEDSKKKNMIEILKMLKLRMHLLLLNMLNLLPSQKLLLLKLKLPRKLPKMLWILQKNTNNRFLKKKLDLRKKLKRKRKKSLD